jgi:hypothetical protein
VIVPFVDIGGIDDHHCLTFLFIKQKSNGIVKAHTSYHQYGVDSRPAL